MAYQFQKKAQIFFRLLDCTGQPWLELETGLVVWPAANAGQYLALNRWQSLAPAFFGFVSRGLAQPHACVYLAHGVCQLAREKLVARNWEGGADAAEVYEWMTGNLLGVWMGERTPYLMTEVPELEKVLTDFE